MCNNGSTNSAARFTFTTPNTPCTTIPSALALNTAAGSLTSSSASIKWSAISGITNYEIAITPIQPSGVTKYIIVAGTTTILTNLSANTKYEIKIRAMCSPIESSDFSKSLIITTLAPCNPPATTISNIGYTTARINWSALTGISGYEVRYKVKGAANWLTPTKTALATATFVDLTNLVLGTTYEYQIRLKCTATNSSEYSLSREFTTQTCTAAPAAPTASQLTLTSARIDWATVVGSLGYELRYRAKGVTTWTSKTATATTTFINLTSLLPGTIYEYELRLKCTSTGFSAFSSTKEFNTISCDVPTPSVLQTSYATARIGWTTIGGALGYELRYRVKGETTWTPKTTTATTTFIDLTALKINTVYEYEMRLKCTSTGFSAYTATREFSTNSCLPVTPSVRSLTAISIMVGWTPQTGVSGYEVSYRKKGAATWIAKPVTGAATSSFNLTALTKSTTYEIRMLTKCLATNGSSAYSNIIEVTTPAQSGADEMALEMPNPLINKVSKENRMTISPNPTNGIVTLQINSAEKGIGQIVVSDYLGRVVFQMKDVSLEEGLQVQEVNLSGLSNGVYVVRLVSGAFLGVQKVLVDR